jgi:hypothetical protein
VNTSTFCDDFCAGLKGQRRYDYTSGCPGVLDPESEPCYVFLPHAMFCVSATFDDDEPFIVLENTLGIDLLFRPSSPWQDLLAFYSSKTKLLRNLV